MDDRLGLDDVEESGSGGRDVGARLDAHRKESRRTAGRRTRTLGRMTAAVPATETFYVTDEEQLRAVIGHPIQRVVDKVKPSLASLHRQWIAASPF